MEMHQIRYFLAVGETLNFTRAAEQCNVTQPALTRAIQKLEEELGGPLLNRERGATRLTELGELMQEHLAQVLAQGDAARTTARGFLKLESAPLNLGLMCTIGPRLLIDFLSELRAKHPGIELNLHEGTPAQLAEELMEGKLEVAIFAQPTPLDPRFNTLNLYSERFTVAFPPGHRFEHSRHVRIADMNGESYLGRLNCEFWDMIGQLMRERQVKLTIPYRSEREDWIQSMVLAGIGVCCLPEHSVVVDGVLTRPVTEPAIVRQVNVVTVAGRMFSPPVAAFIRDVKAYKWPKQLL